MPLFEIDFVITIVAICALACGFAFGVLLAPMFDNNREKRRCATEYGYQQYLKFQADQIAQRHGVTTPDQDSPDQKTIEKSLKSPPRRAKVELGSIKIAPRNPFRTSSGDQVDR